MLVRALTNLDAYLEAMNREDYNDLKKVFKLNTAHNFFMEHGNCVTFHLIENL